MIIETLVKKFEFRKDNGTCNVPECFNKTKDYIVLKEHQLKDSEVRDLGKLFLCDEHKYILDSLLEELNQIVHGDFKTIKAEVY